MAYIRFPVNLNLTPCKALQVKNSKCDRMIQVSPTPLSPRMQAILDSEQHDLHENCGGLHSLPAKLISTALKEYRRWQSIHLGITRSS